MNAPVPTAALPLPALAPGLPVAVIGAGPVGLAAAAHLLERGLQPLVLERGDAVGAHLQAYRHVRLFSPWRYNLDRAALRLLAAAGWTSPPLDSLPTAGALADEYLAPLARLPQVAAALRLSTRVVAISRAGYDRVKTRGREHAPFVLVLEGPAGREEVRASAVLDASGTWGTPNPLGGSGLSAAGEAQVAARIAYGMPDVLGAQRARYAGRHVLVAGAGHSAIGSLVALAELAQAEPGTRISWAIRGDNLARVLGGGAADGFAARGALGTRLKVLLESGRLAVHTRFRISALRKSANGIDVMDETGSRIGAVDEIIAATGARPDLGLARELRTRLDHWLESTEALAPLIDPNVHSCGTVRPHGFRELAHPEPGYFAVGAKSYGRAPNFLMATGYEQVRSIAAALAGDLEAALDVQLELPETGVCSTQFVHAAPAPASQLAQASQPVGEAVTAASACCGGPAVADALACCVADAEARAAGKGGCGCSTVAASPAVAAPPATRTGCGASCG